MRVLNSFHSFRFNSPQPSFYTSHQLQMDSLYEGFEAQATDLSSLTAMSLGSLAFSSLRAFSRPLFSTLLQSTRGVESLTWTTALLGEVGTFRATNQALNANNSEAWNDPRAFLATTMDFALLKGFFHFLRTETFVTRHAVSAMAMVAGEYASEVTHLSEQSEKRFSERFAHAAVASISLEAGGHLSRIATGGSFHRLETRLASYPEVLPRELIQPIAWAAERGNDQPKRVHDFIQWIESCARQENPFPKMFPLLRARFARLTPQEKILLATRLYDMAMSDEKFRALSINMANLLEEREFRNYVLEVYLLLANPLAEAHAAKRASSTQEKMDHFEFGYELLDRMSELFYFWKKGQCRLQGKPSDFEAHEVPDLYYPLTVEVDTFSPVVRNSYLCLNVALMLEVLRMPEELKERESVLFYCEYDFESLFPLIRRIFWEEKPSRAVNRSYVICGELHPRHLRLLYFGHVFDEKNMDVEVGRRRMMMDAYMRLFHGMPLLGYSERPRTVLASFNEVLRPILEELKQGRNILWGIDPYHIDRDIYFLGFVLRKVIQEKIPLQVAIDLTEDCNIHRQSKGEKEQIAERLFREVNRDYARVCQKLALMPHVLPHESNGGFVRALFEIILKSQCMSLHFIGPNTVFFGLGEKSADEKRNHLHHRVRAIRRLGKGPMIVVTFPEMIHRGALPSFIEATSVKVGLEETLQSMQEPNRVLGVNFPHLSSFDYIIQTDD